MKIEESPAAQFENSARQGEIGIIRCDTPPDIAGAKEIPLEDGKLIVGHSESGHHHYVTAQKAKLYRVNAMLAYLYVADKVARFDHAKALSDESRHGSLETTGGWFEIRTKRELSPWGERAVLD